MRPAFQGIPWVYLTLAATAMLAFGGDDSRADELSIEVVRLPSLQIDGQPVRAHTQGLELVQGRYYVTARREDLFPKRALLLRTDTRGTNWEVWDITPADARGNLTAMDHPGGMQSDGKNLWIPLAESKRKGRSVIRVFPMAGMIPGQPLRPDFEFPMDDHIGAVAVDKGRNVVYGANWDTESGYVWDFQGNLKRILSRTEMESRGLGVVNGAHGGAGLAVQDWKVVNHRLIASGLFHGPGVTPELPQSRLMWFSDFLNPGFQRQAIVLPKEHGVELAHEAMAISDGSAYFLPEDLGVSNRIFRVSLADLMKGSGLPAFPSSH